MEQPIFLPSDDMKDHVGTQNYYNTTYEVTQSDIGPSGFASVGFIYVPNSPSTSSISQAIQFTMYIIATDVETE